MVVSLSELNVAQQELWFAWPEYMWDIDLELEFVNQIWSLHG